MKVASVVDRLRFERYLKAAAPHTEVHGIHVDRARVLLRKIFVLIGIMERLYLL